MLPLLVLMISSVRRVEVVVPAAFAYLDARVVQTVNAQNVAIQNAIVFTSSFLQLQNNSKLWKKESIVFVI